jgi:hypothetical protein
MSDEYKYKSKGGAGGITAHYDDMETLAKLYAETAATIADTAAGVLRMATSDDLLQSAALSPDSFKQVMHQLTEIEVQLAVRTVELETLSWSLRAAVSAYKAVDEMLSNTVTGLEYAAGKAIGDFVPLSALAGAAAGYLVLEGEAIKNLPGFLDDLLHGRASLSDFPGRVLSSTAKDVSDFVLAHPGLVQNAIGGAAGLETGILSWLPKGARDQLPSKGTPQTYRQAVQMLAGFFRDGKPVVGPGGPAQPGDDKPPKSVADLFRGVQRRQNRGAGAAVSGEIGVQRLVGADGVIRYVVQLPGTESWEMPGPKARDLSTNLHAMAGGSTVYMRGVEQAMAKAHIPSGAPIMLTGHSQGGMTAAALALDPAFRRTYNVTQVVTAGAPIARSVIPTGVQALAMENRYDLVPQLEGASNADRPNVTTMTFDVQKGTVGRNHDLRETYTRAAVNLPTSDPSYAAWLRTAQGFLDPTSQSSTKTYQITRGPGS